MAAIQKFGQGCRALNIAHALTIKQSPFGNIHCLQCATNLVSVRHKYYGNKHKDPKYKTLRARKVYKIDLPDFDGEWKRRNEELSPEEVRSKLKEKGIAPPRPWNEKPIYMASTNAIIDQYVPPEGDGVASFLSYDKAKQITDVSKRKLKSYREINKIRQFEGDEFKLDNFAQKSIEIYENAHSCLADRDHERLLDYVTEYCYPFMVEGMRHKTIRWKLLENVEPPRVVNVKSGDSVTKGNTYAQITVRFHTKQVLAVYDRHGRLIHGGESSVRQCVEYIVFEKYLANEYGTWRMHSKISPKWYQSNDQPMKKTYALQN